jgi:DNA repair protein SbcD/Mre11
MRLLHTSDWHLGRAFHGQSLLADQELVLAEVADVVAAEHVDVVVIAGDLYDRAVPSPDTVAAASRLLGRIRRAGAQIVAIPGNHDSAARLGAFAEFLAIGGLHLGTQIADVGRPLVLYDSGGPVLFYRIPYLEPDLARAAWGLPAPAGHRAALTAAMDRVRGDLSARDRGARSVVLAHAFVVGGSAGGSERSIAVGGVEAVPADVFDGVDYVALGHLHRPQTLRPHVRYPGSPLPYAFSEAGQEKSVLLVDLAGDGTVSVRAWPLRAARRLAIVRGMLDDVLRRTELADAYLSVELIDAVRPIDPMRRLREVLPHTLVVQWLPLELPTAHRLSTVPEQRMGLFDGDVDGDVDLVCAFFGESRGTPATSRERELVDAAVAAHRAELAAS